ILLRGELGNAGVGALGEADAASLANNVAQGELDRAVATATATGADPAVASVLLTDGYTSALQSVLWILAAVCLVGAFVVWLLAREEPVVAPAAAGPASAELVPAQETAGDRTVAR
nr:hypothetical protein [Micromonospora sp. DSM 115978]